MTGIFLDTGDFEQIKKYHGLGIIRGVTTNPTIMSREKNKGNLNFKKRLTEIASHINPLPLSIELMTNDYKEMKKQAIEFSKWAKNINVKVTIHGPNGEMDNLKIINELEKKEKVRVNCTAMVTAQQCFVAAMAGATYVSIFGGRANDLGYDSKYEIKKLRSLIDTMNLKSKIIAGSVRETSNITDWFHSGAHIVTCPPQFLEKVIIHPHTKEIVKQFLNDSLKLEK